MLFYICIALMAATSVKCQMSPSENYTHSATLRSGNILLYWKFDDIYITFEVIGHTTGWVGIGFSPNGAMTASDIIVGWVKSGIPTVTDRHGGSSNIYPPLDPEQNIEVLGGAESNGWTMYKFSRQIAACESNYDREITSNTEKLIWAYGDTDPTGDDLASGDYHGTKRGVESMYFLQSSGAPTGLPVGPEYNTFEVRASEFTIPSEDTYYNCKLFKLPDFGGKQHVVKWEPIIQTGNELYVHHMIVYTCGDIQANETELEQNTRCYTSNMALLSTCTVIILEWAVGAEEMIYPEEAGLSVGGPGDPKYVQLETHYDNPNVDSGVLDSSGIRFTYTSTLRKYEIGVIQIGTLTNGLQHFIPPGAESFNSMGHCTDACITNRMAASGLNNVTVFSVVLHSHLVGKKLRLRHMRDGVELPYLGNDENYDFNYQEARYFNPGVIMKNTDYFQMECDYNTKSRTVMTEGGYATMEEMCMAFVSYYPKFDLTACQSSVPQHISWSYFGLNEKHIQQKDNTAGDHLSHYILTGPEEVAGKTILEYMSELDWNQQNITNFESFYNSAPHWTLCLPENRSQIVVSELGPFNITTPYIPPAKECLVATTSQTTTSHGHAVKSSRVIILIWLFFLQLFSG
uniref:DBH-like monooxygenase protein 1 homolog n=1 Tax=Styela clava TaxID=7725 RepID=UPI001939B656|nr:DBH-like monooxygenase protein 1 homolog [Styela clava]